MDEEDEGQEGRGGGLAVRKPEESGMVLSITCAPQLSLVVVWRAHVNRSVQGTEVTVRAGAQWGQGRERAATGAATKPLPLRQRPPQLR